MRALQKHTVMDEVAERRKLVEETSQQVLQQHCVKGAIIFLKEITPKSDSYHQMSVHIEKHDSC